MDEETQVRELHAREDELWDLIENQCGNDIVTVINELIEINLQLEEIANR